MMGGSNRGLASVREEEEFSDYQHSHSSNFEPSPINTAQYPIPRMFKKPSKRN